MSKLFLATSFSGHVDYETGQVHPEFRKSVEEVISALREVGGFIVFCAVESENWVISDAPPEVGVEQDLAHIDELDEDDVFLALLPTGVISEGLSFETGYATAKGKRVVVAIEAEAKLGYFNQGVANLGHVAHVAYEDAISLAEQVRGITHLDDTTVASSHPRI